jgi:hypothetical protein
MPMDFIDKSIKTRKMQKWGKGRIEIGVEIKASFALCELHLDLEAGVQLGTCWWWCA